MTKVVRVIIRVPSSPTSFCVTYAGPPFGALKPKRYEQWKEIKITFDPRSMIRGY
jgi:hypothetical protein